MVICLGLGVEGVVDQFTEAPREGIGEDRCALDDTGIAEARLGTCFLAIDQDDRTAFFLKFQRNAEADNSGTQNKTVHAHSRIRRHSIHLVCLQALFALQHGARQACVWHGSVADFEGIADGNALFRTRGNAIAER